MSTPHPRLSMNQGTIKHSTLDEALRAVAAGGYESIGLWREPVQEVGLAEAARRLAASGLRFSTLCRGGFFTMDEGPARRAQLDDNRRAIEETATLAAAGAPGSAAVYVLVAGGLPEGSRDVIGARARVQEALAELAPEAEAAGVTMAIEPLHPMFASDRCVVTTLAQALDLAEPFAPEVVGVTVDTFHIWWDPEVLPQIARAGTSGRIATYQVCDWKTPLPANVLNSRHYPGDGVIDFATLTRAVEQAGYTGDVEVEIFNDDVFATPFDEVVARTAETFAAAVAPHLAAATPAPARARV
ncbi:sugar phosphate isomerase/epimerase family protein [Agromyces larvae]|uniref:Sugar phosphate isomerase/epimerase n=1 Tax=Agromyces larvae TaxID=2929802 RepID=A0ABY4BYE7_9MICO|nr:sugar phosphate isomerase/epimerase [Agromyces larvae]UOE44212.1 sugar phosphate isomerase/epimerase [Agromyces larvae]